MYVQKIAWERPAAQSLGWLSVVVDAQVASTFYPPIGAEQKSSFRRPEGPLFDVYNAPQPLFGWQTPAADTGIAVTVIPPIYEVPSRYQRPAGPEIDVRTITQPQDGWRTPVVLNLLQYQWAPVEETIRSFRRPEGPKLRVWDIPQPEPIYHQSQVVPPQWPPIEETVRSFRTPEAPTIDVRSVPEPEPIYHQSQVIPPLYPPIEETIRSFRREEDPQIDVRNIVQPFFNFRAETPSIRTTLILAEIVIRPQPPQGNIEQPPPILFNTENILVRLTGPAQAMEICSGYVGQPPVLTQLQQVRAHYTTYLAPLTSELHPAHIPQIGRTEKAGLPGVISVKNSWFHLRQTDRYHRVCLNCTGDTEITALTWMLREAGIR